jgi:hypothetical protein
MTDLAMLSEAQVRRISRIFPSRMEYPGLMIGGY